MAITKTTATFPFSVSSLKSIYMFEGEDDLYPDTDLLRHASSRREYGAYDEESGGQPVEYRATIIPKHLGYEAIPSYVEVTANTVKHNDRLYTISILGREKGPIRRKALLEANIAKERYVNTNALANPNNDARPFLEDLLIAMFVFRADTADAEAALLECLHANHETIYGVALVTATVDEGGYKKEIPAIGIIKYMMSKVPVHTLNDFPGYTSREFSDYQRKFVSNDNKGEIIREILCNHPAFQGYVINSVIATNRKYVFPTSKVMLAIMDNNKMFNLNMSRPSGYYKWMSMQSYASEYISDTEYPYMIFSNRDKYNVFVRSVFETILTSLVSKLDSETLDQEIENINTDENAASFVLKIANTLTEKYGPVIPGHAAVHFARIFISALMAVRIKVRNDEDRCIISSVDNNAIIEACKNECYAVPLMSVQ